MGLVNQKYIVEKYGFGKSSVSKWVDKSGIKKIRRGREGVFFDEDEFLAWVKENTDHRYDAQREAARKRAAKLTFDSEIDVTPPDPSSIGNIVVDTGGCEDDREEKAEQLAKKIEEAEQLGIDAPMLDLGNLDEYTTEELSKAILIEDLRIKRAKADIAEGEVIRIEDVENQLYMSFRLVRDALMKIPARLAPALVAETDIQLCRIKIEEEVIAALENANEVLEGYASNS